VYGGVYGGMCMVVLLLYGVYEYGVYMGMNMCYGGHGGGGARCPGDVQAGSAPILSVTYLAMANRVARTNK
jgi:hypothetical protein